MADWQVEIKADHKAMSKRVWEFADVPNRAFFAVQVDALAGASDMQFFRKRLGIRYGGTTNLGYNAIDLASGDLVKFNPEYIVFRIRVGLSVEVIE